MGQKRYERISEEEIDKVAELRAEGEGVNAITTEGEIRS